MRTRDYLLALSLFSAFAFFSVLLLTQWNLPSTSSPSTANVATATVAPEDDTPRNTHAATKSVPVVSPAAPTPTAPRTMTEPDRLTLRPDPAPRAPDPVITPTYGQTRETVSPRVHFFYYCWYGNPQHNGKWLHWDHEVLQEGGGRHVPPHDIGAAFYPKLGLYSSSDRATVQAHMQMMRTAGVGVLVVSWYPAGMSDPQLRDTKGFSNSVLELLFEVAETSGLQIAIHIEPYEGRSGDTVRKDIEYLVQTYGNSRAFYRYPQNNKPLIYFYDSYMTQPAQWCDVFSPTGRVSVRNTPYDINAIGLWVQYGDGDLLKNSCFDGAYTYFATDGFTYGSTSSNWARIRQWATDNDKLFIASVGPGYDDVPLRPWNAKNKRSREDGRYYERMFRAALANKPDLISITSFNEWGEGTQVEPAVPYSEAGFTYSNYQPQDSDYYLRLTRQFVDEFEHQQQRQQ